MDTASLNIGSLSLNDLPSAKIKVDELFLEWLNLNETSRVVDYLLEEAVKGSLDGTHVGDNDSVHIPDSSILNNTAPPPRSPTNNRTSPKKRTQSEMCNSAVEGGGRRVGPGEHLSDAVSQLNFDSTGGDSMNTMDTGVSQRNKDNDSEESSSRRARSSVDSIPVFFVPNRGHRSRQPIVEDELISKLTEIESYFKAFPAGIPFENFVHITKGLCGLPSFFNMPLCRRIVTLFPQTAHSALDKNVPLAAGASNGPTTTKITLKAFLQYWQKEIEPFDRYERFFRLVKQPNVNFISKCAPLFYFVLRKVAVNR